MRIYFTGLVEKFTDLLSQQKKRMHVCVCVCVCVCVYFMLVSITIPTVDPGEEERHTNFLTREKLALSHSRYSTIKHLPVSIV